MACRKLRGGGLYGRRSVSESPPCSKAGRAKKFVQTGPRTEPFGQSGRIPLFLRLRAFVEVRKVASLVALLGPGSLSVALLSDGPCCLMGPVVCPVSGALPCMLSSLGGSRKKTCLCHVGPCGGLLRSFLVDLVKEEGGK